jgi:2-polyprenyl-3-methyl-5-hydroxy-6-metoxy-1,4-benzoquinol methylase
MNPRMNTSEIEIPLLVLWQKSNIETAYFEQQYAFKFCKKYLQDSLQKQGILFNWTHVDFTGSILPHHKDAKYVLVINDPLITINGTIVKRMMKVISMGFSACGVQLNISNNEIQLASPFFQVVNSTSFEELNKMYQDQGEETIEETPTLDPACILYDGKYFLQHGEKPPSVSASGCIVPMAGYRFAVLRNSFIFTFKSAYGDERNDLVALIPSGIKSILDVGCFYGGLGKTLKKFRPETDADGIELSEYYAAKATPYYRKIYNCTLEEFQNEKQYDVVVCGDFLEHLFDPWKQLHRIHDFLNTGGSLITSIPNSGHWSIVHDLLHGKFEYLPWGITCITHIRWFTGSSIRKALEESGFRIEKFEKQQIEPSPGGKDFINKMSELGFGDEQSLLTNEFTIRAVKQ